MKNKIIISMVIVVVLAAITILSGGFNQKNDDLIKPTIKIGVSLPLTGPVSALGESGQKALLLALEDLKNTKYNYEFVFEDDQFKPVVGATIVNKFISADKVSAIFSFGSPVGNAISPVAEINKVPHINFFASDTKVANGQYNFLHYTPPYIDTDLFVKELNERGLKNIIVFEISDNPGAAAISEALIKSISGTEIKIIANPKFTSGTRDFRTLINNVKNLDADIYVLQSSSPELETLFKQIRESGINTPVTSIETFEFADDLSLFEGSWYINSADPQQWFVDKFMQKYNEMPKFGAAHAYDALNILVQVIEKNGDGKRIPTHAEIQAGIKSLKSFNGAMGEGLEFDETGQLISGAVVREVRDGKPITIKKYNP
jgi:ABC-type branched-subunit amino acid transport system substrate-binding protein